MKSAKPLYSILSFFVPFGLYLGTLAPTMLWSDSAKLAIFVQERDFAGYGHGYHPLHTLLGILFAKLPFELAYTQNLMSAFFAAAALLALFHLLRELGLPPKTSLLGCLLLAITHSFWLYSLINETYSLNAFFTVLILLSAVKFRNTKRLACFCSAFFFSGLALYNHTASFLLLPTTAMLCFLGTRFRLRMAWLAPLCFLIGISPMLLIPLLSMGFSDFSRAVFSETSGVFATFFEVKKTIREMAKFPFYLIYQFPSFAILAGLLGLGKLMRRDRILSLSLFFFFLLNSFFAFTYFLQRQFALLIPSYLVFGIWVMFGLDRSLLEEKIQPKKFFKNLLYLSMVTVPFFTYYAFPSIYKHSGLKMIHIRQLPYRDSVEYFFRPDKRWEYSARKYVQDAFARAEKNAVIITDFNPGMALIYGQKIYGGRPDITIPQFIDSIVHASPDPVRDMTEIIEKYIHCRPLYLSDRYEPYYHVRELGRVYRATNAGPMVRLQGKPQPSARLTGGDAAPGGS